MQLNLKEIFWALHNPFCSFSAGTKWLNISIDLSYNTLVEEDMVWLILFAIVSLSSCRTYEPISPVPLDTRTPSKAQSTRLEIIPKHVRMTPGKVDYVYVTVLGQEGNPLPNKEVRVVIGNPAVATLDRECKFTDANGKTVFTLTGIVFPEITILTFYVDGLSYSIEVDGFSASLS